MQGKVTMVERLSGKRTLITGGASGIGFACAERFLAEGARVLLADINQQKGQSAVTALTKQGGQCEFVLCDVAQRSQIANAIERCVSLWGGIDVLINNAG